MSKLYTIFQLSFNSALHIGNGRDFYDTLISELSSDRISSALASIRAQVGKSDDLEEFLNSFSLSTAFPYIENERGSVEYYLPLPRGDRHIVVKDREEFTYRKQLKKLRYAELSLWTRYIAGEVLEVQDNQLQGQFLTTGLEEFVLPFVTDTKQRVVVDKDEGDAVPFFFEWMYFREKSGLYVMLNSDASDALVEEIEHYLQVLGDNGIGSDKSVGGGQFEVKRAQVELPDVSSPNASLSLSTYIPSNNEVALLNLYEAHYSLELRGGFMAGAEASEHRHLVKKSVYCFSTASCFPTTANLTGRVVDLKPTWNDSLHPVFRSGRSLFIPIKTLTKS